MAYISIIFQNKHHMKALLFRILTCAMAISTISSCIGGKEKTENTDSVKLQNVEKKEVSNISNELPTIVDFGATWCGPCQKFAPIFDEAEKIYADRIDFIKVDVDNEPELSQEYNVQSIPTVVYLAADGTEINRTVGLISAQEFETNIKALLK